MRPGTDVVVVVPRTGHTSARRLLKSQHESNLGWAKGLTVGNRQQKHR